MTIRVLMFASLADSTGVKETSLDLDDGASVGAAIDVICAEYPAITPSRDRLARAVNMAYVSDKHVLHDGDELALIPPVSGG